MEWLYSFAGIDFSVELPDDRIYSDTALAPFRVDAATQPHRFCFELVDGLTPPAGECIAVAPGLRVYPGGLRYIGPVEQGWEPAYIRVEHQEKMHRVQLLASEFPNAIASKTVLNCLAAEHLLAENGGFVFHCAFIDRDGGAIAFTAPSGTGKSTQASLWQRYRGAETVNGDRGAIRMTAAGPFACGIPFAGSSGICKNKTLPLRAIVYLKQAPETTIRRLRGAEAFRRIWEGCCINIWDRADVTAVSDTVQLLLQTVPVFELACTPDESAVLALEGAMRE